MQRRAGNEICLPEQGYRPEGKNSVRNAERRCNDPWPSLPAPVGDPSNSDPAEQAHDGRGEVRIVVVKAWRQNQSSDLSQTDQRPPGVVPPRVGALSTG